MSDYQQQQECEFQELWIETQWDEAIKLNQQIDEVKNGKI